MTIQYYDFPIPMIFLSYESKKPLVETRNGKRVPVFYLGIRESTPYFASAEHIF
jgi:hypothetical protein